MLLGALGSSAKVIAHKSEHECESKRAVDEEVAMAFHLASILWVEVNSMSVKGERGVAEK